MQIQLLEYPIPRAYWNVTEIPLKMLFEKMPWIQDSTWSATADLLGCDLCIAGRLQPKRSSAPWIWHLDTWNMTLGHLELSSASTATLSVCFQPKRSSTPGTRHLELSAQISNQEARHLELSSASTLAGCLAPKRSWAPQISYCWLPLLFAFLNTWS